MDIIRPVFFRLIILLLLALDAGSPSIVFSNNHLPPFKQGVVIVSVNGYIMVMAYTNKHDLPLPVVRALTSFEKSEKVEGLRVTTLIDAPRISQLRQRHKAPDEDVSTMLYRILGSAAHLIFQDGAKGLSNSYIPEERVSCEVDGTTISGQIDFQFIEDDEVNVIDYKVTAAYSIIYGKPEWEKQLNVYAFLLRHGKGMRVKNLSVCAIIRDWTARRATTTKGYPASPIVEVPVKMWTDEEQDRYVSHRVQLHINATAIEDLDGSLPLCTDEERWAKPKVFAVHKEGRASALKLFDNQADAEKFASKSLDRKVVERPATYTKCAGDYCRVAQHCDQWGL